MPEVLASRAKEMMVSEHRGARLHVVERLNLLVSIRESLSS